MDYYNGSDKKLFDSLDLQTKNILYRLNEKVVMNFKLSREKEIQEALSENVDIMLIATAYTLRYVCGFGKKRLPEIMHRILNNIDSFRTGHLTLEDCIQELKEYGIDMETRSIKYEKVLKK